MKDSPRALEISDMFETNPAAFQLAVGVALAALTSVSFALTDLPREPIEIGHEPQFFVDDYIVDNRWALRMGKEAFVRAFHQPVKDERNPLIAGKGGYVSVAWDEKAKLYRMVYQDFWVQSPKPNLKYTYAIAYAESKDGIKWELPNLSRCEWKGTKENNICWQGLKGGRTACPFLLDLPPEQRRGYQFVMLYKSHDGVHLVCSNDCIHWDKSSDVRIGFRFWPDTNSSIVWDPKRKEYSWYTRATNIYGDSRGPLDGGATRRVARLSNKGLWTEWPIAPQNILIPDSDDARQGFNFFYGMPTRYYAGIYWGFAWPFKLNTDIYTELMISRNGYAFERFVGRPRLIDLGPEGEWDDGMVFGSPNWVEVGDEWRIYYAGHSGPHGSWDRVPGVGMATIRKEGLVSLRGPRRGGVVCTRAIRWPGGRLLVNCDAKKGSLKVRVSDAKRKVLAGFDYDDCVEFTGDAVAHEVSWEGSSIGHLAGQVIRLEFLVTNGDIYTFRAGASADR